jgi:hypothetical protein
MKEGQCASCGGTVELPDHTQPGRSESCPHCAKDLHACCQCQFFDRAVNNACREERAEWVREKDRANFCDWFVFRGGTGAPDLEHERAEAAKAKLKDFFS